jgi:hypothetical protein
MRQISINRRSNRILYNVTVSLEAAIYPEWLAFMRENHIPKIFSTGCFSGYKICRIIDQSEESYSVAVQYFAVDEDNFRIYTTKYAPALQKEYTARFGSSAPAFRTVLHALEEGEVVSEIEPSKN